jgi:trigger factor
MTANVTKLEENKIRLDVEVPPEAVREGVEAKVRELGRKVRVPGFRPGKAPRRVIENHLGRDYIYYEALQERLPTWYSEAIVETDLRPIDRPEIHFDEPLDVEEGFKFSATVAVRPQAALRGYKGVEVPKEEVEITGDQVDEQLEQMRGQFATLVAVEDRPVREGDFVIIDFRGERMTTGESLEGGEAEDFMLEVGRGELLPDFEQNLVGMKAGERKQFGVTFPGDYAEASLRGQSVLFHVHIKEIKERDLPPLDDEFAKEASEFETLEEMRSAVREQLEAAEERRVEGEFRARVLDAVAKEADVEVPEVMVDDKVEEMLGSFERSLRAQGMEPGQYYQLAGTSAGEIKDRVRPDATDTVKKELTLDAVATAEDIRAGEDEVMQEISHLAEDSEREAQEIAETMRRNGTYALVEEEIARAKALDFLVEYAEPAPMPEDKDVPGAEETEPQTGEASVEASVEAGGGATENEEREDSR